MQNILLLADAALLTRMDFTSGNRDVHGAPTRRGITVTSGCGGAKAGDFVTWPCEDTAAEKMAEHVMARAGTAAAQQVDKLRNKFPGRSSFRIACDAKTLTP